MNKLYYLEKKLEKITPVLFGLYFAINPLLLLVGFITVITTGIDFLIFVVGFIIVFTAVMFFIMGVYLTISALQE